MVAVQETVAVPELVRVLGEIAPQLRPLGIVSVRDIVPVKPLSAATVMVEVSDWPTFAGGGEDPRIEKSGPEGTVTATVVEWEREPLTPVMFTL
jgi:hypothetical protein